MKLFFKRFYWKLLYVGYSDHFLEDVYIPLCVCVCM